MSVDLEKVFALASVLGLFEARVRIGRSTYLNIVCKSVPASKSESRDSGQKGFSAQCVIGEIMVLPRR